MSLDMPKRVKKRREKRMFLTNSGWLYTTTTFQHNSFIHSFSLARINESGTDPLIQVDMDQCRSISSEPEGSVAS